MGITVRVTTPENDALTDTNIDHYSIYADSDNVLIKEFARGTINVGSVATGTVAHNLGYIPFFAAYQNDGSRDSWCYGAGATEAYEVSADTSNIYLKNKFTTTQTFKYYIFYDEVNK